MADQSFLPDDGASQGPDEDYRDADEVLSDLDEAVDLTLSEDTAPPVGKSYAFDFSTGRAVGGRSPLAIYGDATLRGWIEKCIYTRRGAHPIHPPGYGLDWDVIGTTFEDGAVDELEEAMRDALLFHPNIVDVTDFIAVQDPDDEEVLLTSFTVTTDTGNDLDINIPLEG